MPPPLELFSFGSVERSLCPRLYERIDRYALSPDGEVEEQREEGAEEAVNDYPPPPPLSLSWPPLHPPRPVASLSSLPNEVLELICSFASSPGDLLHLSLLSHRFYRLLRPTNRTNRIAQIWDDALIRSRSGKPVEHGFGLGKRDVKKEMGEGGLGVVEYAVLVYGRYCQICSKTGDKDKIVFFHQLRMRCCASCARRNILSQDEIWFAFRSLHLDAFACARRTIYDPVSFERQQPRLIILEDDDYETRHLRKYGLLPEKEPEPEPTKRYFLPEVLAHSAVLVAVDEADQSCARLGRREYVRMRRNRRKREEDVMEDLMWRAKGH